VTIDLSTDALRVAVVHSAPFAREALATVCREGGFEVISVAGTVDDVIERSQEHHAEVIVLDSGVDDGPIEIRLGELAATGARLVVLAEDHSPEQVTLLLSGGVSAMLQLDSTSGHLAEAIRAVAEGAAYLHPMVADSILGQWRQLRAEKSGDSSRPAALTARELEVLAAMTDGLANKAIARRLGITIKTVENHKTRIFDKLAVKTRAQAVSVAIGRALLTGLDLPEYEPDALPQFEDEGPDGPDGTFDHAVDDAAGSPAGRTITLDHEDHDGLDDGGDGGDSHTVDLLDDRPRLVDLSTHEVVDLR
jgi:DNA-binding NarL/FixJ family response regulator